MIRSETHQNLQAAHFMHGQAIDAEISYGCFEIATRVLGGKVDCYDMFERVLGGLPAPSSLERLGLIIEWDYTAHPNISAEDVEFLLSDNRTHSSKSIAPAIRTGHICAEVYPSNTVLAGEARSHVIAVLRSDTLPRDIRRRAKASKSYLIFDSSAGGYSFRTAAEIATYIRKVHEKMGKFYFVQVWSKTK